MDQITFSEAEYQTKKRKTRREIFLERMDKLIPWKQLEKKVARYYPKGQTGRPPYPLPTMLREGSIVDASIISAPSSTKNESGQRDPEMRQTRKGNQWYFGMKMHIGVDDTLGLIHSIDTTAANVHDIVSAGNLLHGDELRVFGDAGYLGIQKRDEHKDRQNVSWFIAKRPGSRKKLDDRKLKAEKLKASARAKVEHPFRYIKQVFGYSKVRYRGLAKNSNRLHLLAAFSNLLMGEKYLLS